MTWKRPHEGGAPEAATGKQQARRHLMPGDGQWAKVPEWVAYKGLDATAWNVLVILAAKAGRERVAWISHRSIGDRLEIARRTVGDAIRRLKKVGVLEEAGKVVVDREHGTWVKRYRVVDRSPDQPVGDLGTPSGSERGVPDGDAAGPDGDTGVPDGDAAPPHSVPQYSIPQISVPLSDAQFEIEKDQTYLNGQTPNPAAKEQPTDVRASTDKIGAYSRFDPDNPKDRATLCVVPGCGKYNHRRTYCSTHDLAEVMPFIERAAAGENR